MEVYRIEDMVKGWFVGDFEPSVIRTSECEVAVKHYKAGTLEPSHYHSFAQEITHIVIGSVRMNERVFSSGDIVLVNKYEIVEFEALVDTVTVVFKSKSVEGDKYQV
jgi:hypothetical protein